MKPKKQLTERSRGLAPRDCESLADILAMDQTFKSVGKYGLLLNHDQTVVLTEQENCEPVRSSIRIPKRVFCKLIEWYMAEQPNK